MNGAHLYQSDSFQMIIALESDCAGAKRRTSAVACRPGNNKSSFSKLPFSSVQPDNSHPEYPLSRSWTANRSSAKLIRASTPVFLDLTVIESLDPDASPSCRRIDFTVRKRCGSIP